MNQSIEILLVEDDQRIVDMNTEMLAADGYKISAVSTLARAREQIEQRLPDMILLDVLMPDGNGVEFCRELREDHFEASHVPVLFLTVKNEIDDIIEGLTAGGDDYLTKPYSEGELRARVAAHLRRSRISLQAEKRIDLGQLKLEPSLRRASFAGKDLMLKPKEYLILSVLVRRYGEIVDEETLFRRAWGYEVQGDSRSLYVNLSTLRTKLREAGIRSIQIDREEGIGYRLIVNEPDE